MNSFFLLLKILLSSIFLCSLIKIKEIKCVAPYALNMYNTDEQMYTEVQDGYCIYYYLYIIVDNKYSPQHYLAPYCIRSLDYLKIGSIGIEPFITFSKLREKGVTTDELFLWSAPIDVIERYQMYLMNISTENDPQGFFNCTWPLFGPVCQFRFRIKHDSIFYLVSNSMRQPFYSNEDKISEIIKTRTCYVDLECDYIYPWPMCLGWRDICDGRVHCLNNEIDEKNCFQLELNECDEGKEYRCHNGQCIPKEFFLDNSLFPDCLDRSDEFIDYSTGCYLQPSMRCDDHTCRPGSMSINCGDGESHEYQCRNGYFDRWEISLTSKPNKLPFPTTCWNAINCLTQIHISIDDDHCRNSHQWNLNVKIIRKDCPSIFVYPIYPVALGHIYFIYQNNQSFTYIENIFALPTYICFNEKLCPIFSSSSSSSSFPRSIYLSINSTLNISSCHSFSSLSNFIQINITIWLQLRNFIEKFYSKLCLKPSQIDVNINTNCASYSNLYLCQNSTKCISKYRLLDGMFDCPMNDDEFYEDSCSLTNIHRQYQCLINKTMKCVSPMLFFNEENHCQKKLFIDNNENFNEKFDSNSLISFQTLCDGFEERERLLIDNSTYETDETNCDLNIWPCDNIYTHCDHYWNCPNGIDEINCSYLFEKTPNERLCPPLEHKCISPFDFTIICLELTKINDNVIDCLGGTDERQLCRNDYSDPFFRYRCSDENKCIPSRTLCSGEYSCLNEENEHLCQHIIRLDITLFDGQYRFPCTSPDITKKSLIVKILCYLDESAKPNRIYFSLKNSMIYPKIIFINKNINNDITEISNSVQINSQMNDEGFGPYRRPCNRGITIQIRYGLNRSFDDKCLCSPGYYGSNCQYENQRIVLTVQFRVENEWRTIFSFLFLLIDNDENVQSYEKLSYLSTRDCNAKFHIYFLYKTRPKNLTKEYSIRIHGFDLNSLQYRTSWLYQIQFPFLPVHRMSIQLNISRRTKQNKCLLDCGQYGNCIEYENNPKQFCLCHSGWKGKKCDIFYQCSCAQGSFCIESKNICLCPMNRDGSRCYIEQTICQKQSENVTSLCLNDGICIPSDIRYIYNKNRFSCICPENTGEYNCQYKKSEIELLFDKDVPMPYGSIFSYFITVNNDNEHEIMSMLSKISFNQRNIILYISNKFHIIFIKIVNDYYLTALLPIFEPFSQMKISIQSSQRCLHIKQLFNKTIINFHPLRRTKFYHLACRENFNLKCFYDLDSFMCLCNNNHHANCFNFNYNLKYDCQGNNYCLNNGHCFQDKPQCPTMSVCSCLDCFYGSICQFSSEGFSLSLDSILGYHIELNLSILYQSNIVKISFVIVILMFIIGFISVICTMITFIFTRTSRTIGCGIYILTLSIIDLLILNGFLLKFILLLLTQNGTITNQWILKQNCIFMDYIIRVLLNIADWLNVCIGIERTLTIAIGINFNKLKSKKVSKWMVLVVILVCSMTAIQDPLNRQLIYIEEDKKTWCIIHYNSQPILKRFDSIMNLIHFIIPFLINLISSLIIVILTARIRSNAHEENFVKKLRQQLRQHYHLIVSPCLSITLAVPRIIISLYNACLKSINNPQLALSGYFLSFSPTVLIFFMFILPSDKYRNNFKQVISRLIMPGKIR